MGLTKEYKDKVSKAIIDQYPSVEKVYFRANEEIEAYGTMPNTDEKGWYLFCYVEDLKSKGITVQEN